MPSLPDRLDIPRPLMTSSCTTGVGVGGGVKMVRFRSDAGADRQPVVSASLSLL